MKSKKVNRARKSFYIVGVGASAVATFVQTLYAAQFQDMLRNAIYAEVELTAFTQVAALQLSSKAQDTSYGLP